MSKEARKHWNDLVPQMSQMGILAYIDWPKLYRICYLWAKIMKIEADAEKDFAVTKGKVITKPDGTVVKEGGNVIYNPAASRLDKLWDKYNKLASEFCMGPVHRAGMGGIQKSKKEDEKSRFFNKNA